MANFPIHIDINQVSNSDSVIKPPSLPDLGHLWLVRTLLQHVLDRSGLHVALHGEAMLLGFFPMIVLLKQHVLPTEFLLMDKVFPFNDNNIYVSL